ncbi:peptidoglycan-binding protein [Micromonospora sp. C51]|uniref:peptidoglycan-binding protein n=1 Tax=Micromonospora sp. C51 TaxID=2824879 RepID=UPI001B3882FA|nr:peptidoglycan-binding domain-containing protein [Micromonospora sp. C51]MBQ1050239.1 peptidoglycan-binding protein [Micromonospora sp. C51]
MTIRTDVEILDGPSPQEPTDVVLTTKPPRRRGMKMSALLGAVGVLVAVSFWQGLSLQDPDQVAADAAPPPPSHVTVAAEQRVLAEPLVLRGRVSPGSSVPVRPPAALVGPDSVVTRVDVRRGDELREGRLVLETSGNPLIALRLAFPLYRDLVGGMTGPDVHELQQAMRRIGYRVPLTKRFDNATQQAVRRWWGDLGYRLPQAVDQPGTPPADDSAAASDRGDATDVTSQRATVAAGPVLPRSAILRVSRSPAKVTAVAVRVGQIIDQPDKALLQLNGGAPYVSTVVAKEQVELLSVGQMATVTDDVSGRTAKAEIASIGAEVRTDESTGTTGFPVKLTFTSAALNAADRSVRLDIASATSTEPQLAVPVTAVYSRADGSAFVTVLKADEQTLDVPVQPGQGGGGWVAITPAPGDAVVPGTLVVVGHA